MQAPISQQANFVFSTPRPFPFEYLGHQIVNEVRASLFPRCGSGLGALDIGVNGAYVLQPLGERSAAFAKPSVGQLNLSDNRALSGAVLLKGEQGAEKLVALVGELGPGKTVRLMVWDLKDGKPTGEGKVIQGGSIWTSRHGTRWIDQPVYAAAVGDKKILVCTGENYDLLALDDGLVNKVSKVTSPEFDVLAPLVSFNPASGRQVLLGFNGFDSIDSLELPSSDCQPQEWKQTKLVRWLKSETEPAILRSFYASPEGDIVLIGRHQVMVKPSNSNEWTKIIESDKDEPLSNTALRIQPSGARQIATTFAQSRDTIALIELGADGKVKTLGTQTLRGDIYSLKVTPDNTFVASGSGFTAKIEPSSSF